MKKSKKLIAFLLTVLMVLSLGTVMASADETEEPVIENENFVVNKTAELQQTGDLAGTYTISLEAYAKGQEVTTTTVTHLPLDIVLVLDVSGSMKDEISSSTTTTTRTKVGTNKDTSKLKTNGNHTYVIEIDGVDHSVTRSNFGRGWIYDDGSSLIPPTVSSLSGTYDIYEIKTTTTTTTTKKIEALKNSVKAFIDVVAADAAENNVEHTISIVKYGSAKYYGGSKSLTEGNHRDGNNYNYTEVLKNFLVVNDTNVTTLKAAVDSLNHGGATAIDYGMELASDLLAQDSIKNDQKGKTIVLFTDGTPTHGSDYSSTVADDAISTAKTLKTGATLFSVGLYSNPSTNQTNFMNYISSNYPDATSMNNPGTKSETGNYYMSSTNADDLNDIFVNIASEAVSGGASISADSTTQTIDVVADTFALPANISAEDVAGVKVYTASVNPTASNDTALAFLEKEAATDVTVTVNEEDQSIKVTGFDFSANWCGKDGHNTFRGKKLIIELEGITPKESAFTGSAVKTNGSGSQVQAEDGTVISTFVSPTVNLPVKAIVIDYAKPVQILPSSGLSSIAKFLHSGSNTASSALPTVASGDLKYGDVVNKNGVYYYQLGTTSFTGEETICVFGPSAENSALNAWAKVGIQPASNVYYEDTFVSATGEEGTKLNGIVWSGSWTAAAEGSNTVSTTEDGRGDGWIEGIADESGYTDGGEHKTTATDGTASATITFTGTGIDVYTTTTAKSGVVIAILKSLDADSTMKTKLLKVYNESKSGTFYSVPTLSFNGLTYGNYKLTIMATSDTVTRAQGLDEYSIDGIRIYNPANNGVQYVNINKLIGSTDTIYLDETGDIRAVNAEDVDKMQAANEVYLKGTAVVSFNAGTTNPVYVGMKSSDGTSVTAEVTNGAEKSYIPITHTGDLYYQITPNSEGIVTIRNSGDGILVLTKLQTSASAADLADGNNLSEDKLFEQAKHLASCEAVPYTVEPVEEVLEAVDAPIIAPQVEVTESAAQPDETEAADQDTEFVAKVMTIMTSFKKLFGRV